MALAPYNRIILPIKIAIARKFSHPDWIPALTNSQPRRYTLTDAALETLSIIAYKQPVTKIEIENIRGVNSDRAVSKLVELGLVKEVGRLDAPGRPMLFGTTEDFLRSFGVQSIDELPTISEDMVEQYKEEAELELASESFDADNQEDSDGQITLGI